MKKTYGIDSNGQLNKSLTKVLERPWVYRIDVTYRQNKPMSQKIMVALVKGWVFLYETEEEQIFFGPENGIHIFRDSHEAMYHTQKRRVKQIKQE